MNNIEKNEKTLNALSELNKNDNITKFYHYTTMDGVKGIFKNYINKINKNPEDEYVVDECCLRASNVRYLNDSMEYKEGIATLSKSTDFSNISELDENIYNISFCRNGNLLSQWDRYGKSSGIAIEFDFNSKIKLGFVRQIKRGKEEKTPLTRWDYKPINVEYENQEASYKYMRQKLSFKIPGEDNNDIINAVFVPLCKNVGFKQEEESRIILYAQPLKNFIYDIDYIVDKDAGTVKPSLNVLFKGEDSRKNIIKSITVGPGNNQNLIFNAMIHIFDRRNYHFYEEDKIAEWKNSQHSISNQIIDKEINYYFGKEDGSPFINENESTIKKIDLLKQLKSKLENDSSYKLYIKAINSATKALEKEYKKAISEEIKKNSVDNFIIHKCENGIFIKKSLIPYRF